MSTLMITFLVAMVPVLELRGAIPYGIANGLSPMISYLVSVIGNLVPVPFIISFIRQIFRWLRNYPGFRALVQKMEDRINRKSGMILQYAYFGLLILVAIPLPGTGAWTGAAAAALMQLRMKYSLIAITLGVLLSGLIVTGLSCGVIHILS